MTNAKKVAYIVSNSGTITLFIGEKNHSVDTTHPNYQRIKDSLRDKKYDSLESLVDIPRTVAKYSGSQVTVDNGVVKYQGEVIHNSVVNKILQFVTEGFDINPLVKFLENLMQNPSKRSVDSLYEFLERHDLVIDEDGFFLAYKKVNSNWMDFYKGEIDNSVGNTVRMSRNKISDDVRVGCSFGLHVGSLNYAAFEYHPGQGKLIVVRVNPKDVVSVPEDCNHQKMRVAEYKVMFEMKDTNLLEQKAYAQPYNAEVENDDDWDDTELEDEWNDDDGY